MVSILSLGLCRLRSNHQFSVQSIRMFYKLDWVITEIALLYDGGKARLEFYYRWGITRSTGFYLLEFAHRVQEAVLHLPVYPPI
jgi:hypothetical protein